MPRTCGTVQEYIYEPRVGLLDRNAKENDTYWLQAALNTTLGAAVAHGWNSSAATVASGQFFEKQKGQGFR